MSTREILDEFEHLSLDEKLRLLEALWGRVAPADVSDALTEEQRRALQQRLVEVERDERPSRSVEAVCSDLRNRRRS